MSSLPRIAVVLISVLPLAFAQSTGAPKLPGGTSPGVPTPVLPIAVYGNIVNGPTVGPDGDAYVVRTRIQTTTTPITSTTELVQVARTLPSSSLKYALPCSRSLL